MILQPCNVELTKIHYYDDARKDRNVSIPTISREVWENNFNKNVIIKKNVFGHRWVLKINETKRHAKKKGKLRLVVYVLVFCSIVVAVCFGIFFSLDKDMFKRDHKVIHIYPENNNTGNYFYKTHENQIMSIPQFNDARVESTTTDKEIYPVQNTICPQCNPKLEVCLKMLEVERPKCVKILDKNDPTGCGGLCPINTHFCHVLDFTHRVYQCSVLRNTLRCTKDHFNCGNRCILQRQRCDGIVDCSNFSDERNCACNLTTHFQCRDTTSCFEKSQRCDQKIDCWDKSDEMDCHEALTCEEEEMRCTNGQCMPEAKFCDGTNDCPDGSDEPEGCEK